MTLCGYATPKYSPARTCVSADLRRTPTHGESGRTPKPTKLLAKQQRRRLRCVGRAGRAHIKSPASCAVWKRNATSRLPVRLRNTSAAQSALSLVAHTSATCARAASGLPRKGSYRVPGPTCRVAKQARGAPGTCASRRPCTGPPGGAASRPAALRGARACWVRGSVSTAATRSRTPRLCPPHAGLSAARCARHNRLFGEPPPPGARGVRTDSV